MENKIKTYKLTMADGVGLDLAKHFDRVKDSVRGTEHDNGQTITDFKVPVYGGKFIPLGEVKVGDALYFASNTFGIKVVDIEIEYEGKLS